MNDLSWLIYFAGIVNGIGNFAGGVSFALFVLMGMIAIGSFLCSLFGDTANERDLGLKVFKTTMKWIWVPVLLAFICIITPDQKTVYMIAASEMGETVITNPGAQDIFNDLKDIINLQLDAFKSDLTKE